MFPIKRVTILISLIGSLFSTTIEAQLQGYPVIGPPSVGPAPTKEEWSALLDQSKIPQIPVVSQLGVCDESTKNSCNWSCLHCNQPDDVVFCPVKKDWGLTFDDGPSQYTPALVDYLDSKGVKATFFVIGSHVVQYPEILKKVVESGHEVGIHTYSHMPLTTLTNEQIVAELKWTEQAIKEAGGVTPKLVRPPSGDMDDRVRSIFKQLNYTAILWDKDSSDWKSNSDPTFDLSWVGGNFTQWVQDPNDTTGHISLEHDFWQQTAAQGPIALDILLGANFNVKTMANCRGLKPYLEVSPTPTSIQAYGNSSSMNNNTISAQNVESTAALKHQIKVSLTMGLIIGTIITLVL